MMDRVTRIQTFKFEMPIAVQIREGDSQEDIDHRQYMAVKEAMREMKKEDVLKARSQSWTEYPKPSSGCLSPKTEAYLDELLFPRREK